MDKSGVNNSVNNSARGAGHGFLGRYRATIDEKFRFVVPSPFRKTIKERTDDTLITLFPGPKNTILFFTQPDWKGFWDRFLAVYGTDFPALNPDMWYFNENTWQTRIDGEGRILIPEELRRHAEITAGSEVAVRGFGNCFGVTSKENFEKEESEKRLKKLLKRFEKEESSLEESSPSG